MKKIFLAMGCAASLLAVAGCSTVRATNSFNEHKLQISESGESVAHINGTISGFYLFWFIPVWSGDDKAPGTPVFFTNSVKVSSTVGMISKHAADHGATRLLDINTSYNVFPGVPVFNWFFCIKECQASGNAVKK